MKIWMLMLIIAASSKVLADPIYKSTDIDGRISYSATVPHKSQVLERIDPIPQPTKQQVFQAKQRYLALEARQAVRAREQARLAAEYAHYKEQKKERAWRRRIERQRRTTVLLLPGQYSLVTRSR